MVLVRILLFITANVITVRTIFRCIGRKTSSEDQNFDTFVALVVCSCAFLVSKLIFFLILGIFLIFVRAGSAFLSRKNDKRTPLLTLYDDILMEMRAGRSFEAVKRNRTSSLIQTNGQKNAQNVFDLCSAHPSQAYNILQSAKNSLRLQEKLIEKQKTLTLQVKAQACVSGLLFILVFIAEFWMLPDFSTYLRTAWGKGMLTLSFLLVAVGIMLVFRMSKPVAMAV